MAHVARVYKFGPDANDKIRIVNEHGRPGEQ